MIKTVIIGLIAIAMVSAACHNSCNCQPGSNVCDSCKSPLGDDSQLENFGYRYCPCSFGTYMSSLSPFTCTEVPIVEDMPACELQIVGEVVQLVVGTDCKAIKEGELNFVESIIRLDTNRIIRNGGCLSELSVEVNYKDPLQVGNPYVPFTSPIHTVGEDMTIHKLKIPLGDVTKYSIVNTKDEDTIANEIHVVIEIGHQRKKVRAHTYKIFIYTNRDQVQTFKIDVDVQRTDGCQEGQECIVVADLDVKSKIYTNNLYNVVKTELLYEVGQIFYAQILFKDPTYNKKLLFDNLYFKTSDNKIFDLSAIVKATSFPGGLNIELPLVYPTSQATIQVNMRIGGSRFRTLLSEDTSVNEQFTVVTIPKKDSNVANTNGNMDSSQSGTILALSFAALFSLLI